MLTLTPTLQAAIRRADRQPTIAAIVTDQPCERPRWTWTQVYGPADQDGPHAVAQMYSGSLVRARQQTDGKLYTQKIADPAQASQWSAWTLLTSTSYVPPEIALASSTTEDRLRLFWVDAADGRTIKVAESTDGTTWTTTTVYTEPIPRLIRGLAADMQGGDNHLIYVVDLATGSPDEALVAIEKVGAVWTNRVQHGETRYSTNGVCAAKDPSAGLIYVGVADAEGTNGAERRISFQEFDAAANAWGGGTVLAKHGASSGYDFRKPRLRLASTAFPRHAYTWVEQYGGPPSYSRPMIGVTPQRYWLTEWVPWDVESAYGFELLRAASGAWYLVGAQRAYSSPGYTGGVGQRLDVSADVLDLRLESPGPHRPTRGTLVLANGGGRYDAAGVSGAALCLRQGSQVAIRLGLRTSAGDEGCYAAPLWVEEVAHTYDGREAALEVGLVDCWGLLERLRTALTVQFPTATTVGYVLDRALWRVTAASTAGPSGLGGALSNAVWAPGRDFAEIARSLCRLAGVYLRFRTVQSVPDGAGFASVATDAQQTGSTTALYDYGAGAHPITAYRLASGGQAVDHVAVQGARSGPYRAEAHDFAAIKLLWRRFTRPFTDLRLNAQADAQRTADALLREAQQANRSGWIDAPLNPAQELGDTVSINGTAHAVVGMKVRWSRRPVARADMRLEVSAP